MYLKNSEKEMMIMGMMEAVMIMINEDDDNGSFFGGNGSSFSNWRTQNPFNLNRG